MQKNSDSFWTISGCDVYNDVINIDWCKTCPGSVNTLTLLQTNMELNHKYAYFIFKRIFPITQNFTDCS
jgi:hypothetical protein